MKLAVFQDVELDESGVTTYWYYECYHTDCEEEPPAFDGFTSPYHARSYLVWENAIAGANRHIKNKHFPQKAA